MAISECISVHSTKGVSLCTQKKVCVCVSEHGEWVSVGCGEHDSFSRTGTFFQKPHPFSPPLPYTPPPSLTWAKHTAKHTAKHKLRVHVLHTGSRYILNGTQFTKKWSWLTVCLIKKFITVYGNMWSKRIMTFLELGVSKCPGLLHPCRWKIWHLHACSVIWAWLHAFTHIDVGVQQYDLK